MPLQQISLDQSIYNKPKWGANVQQGGAAKPRGGFAAAGGTQPNRFVEEQKAQWAAEDKAKKEERDAQMAQLQNIGAQTVKQAQQATLAQAKQQQAIKQQVESNPEPAAKEMYELMKTLPDDAKQQLLQQIFTPTKTGGFIQAGGVKKDMPDKYNPIANVFLQKGWAMFDPQGNVNLSEPEPTYEKGTFEIVERGGKVYKFNTATNEEIEIGKTDDPNTPDAVVKQIRADAIAMVNADPNNKITVPEAMFDAAIDYGYSNEDAEKLAKIDELPEGIKKKNKIKEWWAKITKPSGEKPAYLGKGKTTTAVTPTFKEENVTALVSVISDDVTAAERAYLKGQGASDSDIDEAIKRKGSK